MENLTAPTEMTVNVMGMVRDYVVGFTNIIDAPAAWTRGDDKPSGRKVAMSKEEAKEVAEYLMSARTWATEAFQFPNPGRKSNALRHGLRIAKEIGAFAGLEIEAPSRPMKGKEVTELIDLPKEAVNDLEVGDEIVVVRHITRYGLNVIDRFGAKVKGRTKGNDYWVTSLEDGSSRACRPTEVILVKRAEEVATTDPTTKPRGKKAPAKPDALKEKIAKVNEVKKQTKKTVEVK
jgi:hypothetical protein